MSGSLWKARKTSLKTCYPIAPNIVFSYSNPVWSPEKRFAGEEDGRRRHEDGRRRHEDGRQRNEDRLHGGWGRSSWGMRTVAVAIMTVLAAMKCRKKRVRLPLYYFDFLVNLVSLPFSIPIHMLVSFKRFSRSSTFSICQEKREKAEQMRDFGK